MAVNAREIVRAIVKRCRPAAYLFIPAVKLMDTAQGGRMHREMEQNIRRYCTPQQQADKAYLRRLRRDMWRSFILYYCPFDEYFIFQFPRLSHLGRQEFVTDYEKGLVCEGVSSASVRDIFWDKWQTYEHFREYYGRDAMKIDADTAPDELAAFAAKHPQFIIKPREDCGGHGVSIFSAGDKPLPQLLEELRDKNVMLEELIVQTEALSKLHPASVNTVRCATFLKDGEAHILFTFFRTGRSGSVVDNAGAGGFVAFVDLETGIVSTPGVTETLETALVHPDTGEQIIGLKIPQWEEMKAFARQLSLLCPQQPYSSWDLALTDDGWVMVEGNAYGQFICPQFTTQRGMRRQLSQYFDL